MMATPPLIPPPPVGFCSLDIVFTYLRVSFDEKSGETAIAIAVSVYCDSDNFQSDRRTAAEL